MHGEVRGNSSGKGVIGAGRFRVRPTKCFGACKGSVFSAKKDNSQLPGLY